MRQRMLTVYLAGPITGCSYGDCTDWRDKCEEEMDGEFIFLSPMRSKLYLSHEKSISASYETGDPFRTATSAAKGINARDYWDCKKSDIIFVNLLGAERASIGTSMEIGWGHTDQKPVIVCMEPDNIHQHPMIQECATHILEDFDVACRVLRSLR